MTFTDQVIRTMYRSGQIPHVHPQKCEHCQSRMTFRDDTITPRYECDNTKCRHAIAPDAEAEKAINAREAHYREYMAETSIGHYYDDMAAGVDCE